MTVTWIPEHNQKYKKDWSRRNKWEKAFHKSLSVKDRLPKKSKTKKKYNTRVPCRIEAMIVSWFVALQYFTPYSKRISR